MWRSQILSDSKHATHFIAPSACNTVARGLFCLKIGVIHDTQNERVRGRGIRAYENLQVVQLQEKKRATFLRQVGMIKVGSVRENLKLDQGVVSGGHYSLAFDVQIETRLQC